MDAKFSRSFFGYEEEEVLYRINLLNKEYEEKMRELTDKLFASSQEIEVLQESIRRLEEEIAELDRLNTEIKETLFSAHMEATRNVYAAMKNSEKISKKTREKVYIKEKESLQIKRVMESLAQDVESIAQCYNRMLEAHNHG